LQTKWDSLLAALKVGDRMTNVEAILKAHGIKYDGPGLGGAGWLSREYRFDEAWLLRCEYRCDIRYPAESILQAWDLQLSPIYVGVNPPTNFTGVWIVYYINGQKCLETNLKAGAPYGDQICYRFDGSKDCVEHHDPNQAEVGWTQYYHSGGIMTRGKRDKNWRPIGTWTNYSESDGSILDTHTWINP
jgi:hypothetical protein